jgi:hypothetical protein
MRGEIAFREMLEARLGAMLSTIHFAACRRDMPARC